LLRKPGNLILTGKSSEDLLELPIEDKVPLEETGRTTRTYESRKSKKKLKSR